MFERFTDRARRVVVTAQEEARDLGHDYIGTEHLLLGLIHEKRGVAAKALEALGISLDAVRREVEGIVGRGKDPVSAGHIPFTPRAKKVLELSLREALELNHNYIGTEHILLGLVREGEGAAARALTSLGAELPAVRDKVRELVASVPVEGATAGALSALMARGGRAAASERLDTIIHRLDTMTELLAVIAERLGVATEMPGEETPDGEAPPATEGPPASAR